MLEGFLWLSTQERYPAYCLTFAQGLSETELLRRFGGDLSSARWVRFGDEATEELERFGDVIQVGQCDGWAFAYEWGEWRGADPENLSDISAGTVVVSVCYASAITVFCYMEDKRTIAYFDPLFPPYAMLHHGCWPCSTKLVYSRKIRRTTPITTTSALCLRLQRQLGSA